MDKLKWVSGFIFWAGCIVYALVNLVFAFANDFADKYADLFEQTRNISFVVFMVGLFLLIVMRIIEKRSNFV